MKRIWWGVETNVFKLSMLSFNECRMITLTEKQDQFMTYQLILINSKRLWWSSKGNPYEVLMSIF